MDTILKVVHEGIVSLSANGKEFTPDEKGQIAIAEEDGECVRALLATGAVKYLDDFTADEEAAEAARKKAYDDAVDAEARKQIADEEFQTRVEARALELLAADATPEEKDALTKAVEVVKNTRPSAKKQ